MAVYEHIPVIRSIWAFWRVREAAIRRRYTALPPVIEQFQPGEVIALKGFEFRVAHRGQHGLVLAPVGLTGRTRKRLSAFLRSERRKARYVAETQGLRGSESRAQ